MLPTNYILYSNLCDSLAYKDQIIYSHRDGEIGDVGERAMESTNQNSVERAFVRMVVLSLRGIIVVGLGLLLVALRAWQRDDLS